MAGPVAVALVVTAVMLAVPSSSSAAPAQREAARLAQGARSVPGSSGSDVKLAVSSPYQVTVPPGTWVPVDLSVTDSGPSDLQGEIVVQAPAAQAGLSTPGCLSNGPSTFTCLGTENYSSNLQPGPAGTGSRTSTNGPGAVSPATVEYKIPLELAAGTEKQLPLYVLTGAPGAGVSARVQGPSGRVLAHAGTQLPVAFGLAAPAVLVVTDDPPAVSVLTKLVAPTGAQAQLQYTTPSALPATPVPLGAFRAVVIDQADTTAWSPAQAQALESYVDAGGTLVVAGGLNWRATEAGLPAGLLPGHSTGTVSSLALPGLSRLLGTRPLPGRVDLNSLEPVAGATETLAQGTTPLALQVRRGTGHVVLIAFDPAAAPLAEWAGAQALLSRLFAPAYQPDYYDSPLPYAEAGGVFPVPPSSSPTSTVAKLGGNFDTGSALMSPATAATVLASYLEQAPAVTRPPAVSFLGLLLVGYVVLVALVLFVVLGRPGRRALAWTAVPTVAVIAVLAAGLAGVGGGRGPLVEEVRVAQLSPGGHLAQVTSLGMVQLPGGGTRQVDLSTPGSEGQAPALVSNLAVGTGAAVTVGQGRAPFTTSVTVSGGAKSRGGWSASEIVHLAGSVRADVSQSGGILVGSVRNAFGVKLTHAEVVVASGEASQELGTLAPGGTAWFGLAPNPNSSPLAQAFGAPAPVPVAAGADVLQPPRPVGTGAGSKHGGRGSRTAPAAPPVAATEAEVAKSEADSDVQTALVDLAASYSTQQSGAPVFVAIAAHNLFPPDATAGAARPAVTDVVVVPLADEEHPNVPLADLPGELVGSAGVTSETEYAITTGSLTLGAGGSFDYQFMVPGTRWRRLELDLGSSSGETYGPPLVRVEAYDYAAGRWDALRVKAHSGELLAQIPDAARHVGPGGTLDVRVVATENGVEVYGGFPTLSATPPGRLGTGTRHGGGATTAPFTVTPLPMGLSHSGAARPGLARSGLAPWAHARMVMARTALVP